MLDATPIPEEVEADDDEELVLLVELGTIELSNSP
jgi:hypothetical protein